MRLIDADALINDILTDYGCDPKYIADETIDGLKPYTDQLILERIGLQPTIAAPHWHRVEDALPDLLQFVVVCNDEGKCVVAQYVGYQTDSLTSWRIAYTMYDTDIYDEKECGPVRYWMPIEPPKEDA